MVPPPTRDRWFAYRRPPTGARQRLFCFPHAGGGASLFREWHGRVPADMEIYPVQLPGRETRFGEVPFTRLDELILALMDAIRDRLDVPFSLLGHSNGAVIAWALARRLEEEGLPSPRLLIVSAHRAPHLPEPNPRGALPDHELLDELKRLDGTPAALLEHPEVMRLLLPVYRADLQVGESRYPGACREALSCAIAAYGGSADPEVTPDDLQAWKLHSAGRFRVRIFPGNHFYMKTASPEFFEALATDLVDSSRVREVPA